jgi:hypothetical protein
MRTAGDVHSGDVGRVADHFNTSLRGLQVHGLRPFRGALLHGEHAVTLKTNDARRAGVRSGVAMEYLGCTTWQWLQAWLQ